MANGQQIAKHARLMDLKRDAASPPMDPATALAQSLSLDGPEPCYVNGGRRRSSAKQRSASISSCVQWHPNGKLALTAGLDKTLRLFRTDGVDNPKLQSIFVDRLPITSASFTADGSQVVLCGSAKHW